MIARALLAGLAAGMLAACSAGAQTVPEDLAQRGQAGVLTIEPKALALRLEAGDAIQLIDVRTPEEFAEGHLEGAINVPLDSFDPAALPDAGGAERILYCRSARRSGEAAERMAQGGATAVHMAGGIVEWEASGLPVER